MWSITNVLCELKQFNFQKLMTHLCDKPLTYVVASFSNLSLVFLCSASPSHRCNLQNSVNLSTFAAGIIENKNCLCQQMQDFDKYRQALSSLFLLMFSIDNAVKLSERALGC